jgi:ubiquinone/menaquinone biosynthesis C-methylase UbiE
MTKWKEFFDEKIKEIAREKIVFDIGGCSKFQKSLAPYKEYFLNCEYKTVDVNPDCHPDILATAQNLPIPDNSADGVICKSVLEHVENPFKAVDEIYRILKPGGKCFIYVPFLHPYHASGQKGKDYWRFSEDGIKHLFKEFRKIEICPVKRHFETIACLLPYQNKFPINILVYLARFLDIISERYQSKKQVSGSSLFLVK